jgi:hypothetical protein
MKFINFKRNYKSGLALEIKSSPKERVKTNHKQMKEDDTMICFTGSLSTLSLSQTVT